MVNLQMVFFLEGGLHGFVCRTKMEDAEALEDLGLLVYTVDKREEIKDLFATTITSVVVGSTFQTHILPHKKLHTIRIV